MRVRHLVLACAAVTPEGAGAAPTVETRRPRGRFSNLRLSNLLVVIVDMEKMNKLFVTGGAGFIGSAFVRLVLAEIPGCEVVNFDALTYAGNLDNLAGLEDVGRHRF